jgi:hypothetical protein
MTIMKSCPSCNSLLINTKSRSARYAYDHYSKCINPICNLGYMQYVKNNKITCYSLLMNYSLISKVRINIYYNFFLNPTAEYNNHICLYDSKIGNLIHQLPMFKLDLTSLDIFYQKITSYINLV